MTDSLARLKRIDLNVPIRYADKTMTLPLDLELLKTFVAVAESGSFSSAAPRVSRSQSALSMQMQRLEQSMGKTLLVRGSRTVRPSAAGEELLGYARRLLRLSEEATAAVTRPQETGNVRLGANLLPGLRPAITLPGRLSRCPSRCSRPIAVRRIAM